jgi:uncharacterized membrane protein YdjX (TVP38/TMEM64 family)
LEFMHEAQNESGPALRLRRLVPLLLLLAGAVAFFALGLGRYLSFAGLAENCEWLEDQVARLGPFAVLAYIAIYATVAALSVPGATVLTVAGGFLFGTAAGGIYALVGATIGATLVFLIARTSLGEILQRRAGPAMRKLEAGFKANAASYLLVLRLVPLFPFWLVNLVAAFLGVPLRTFVLYSFVGMAPGAFVYASLGQGASTIIEQGRSPDLHVIFTPRVLLPIIALAVLAMVPVVYRQFRSRALP